MHEGEISTDETLVRRLLCAQFPHWSDLPIRAVPSAGTDNALYRLGDSMVVRLPRIDRAVESIEKEASWLPVLAPQLPLPVTMPLALGAPGLGYPWPWSICRWIDGANPLPDALEQPSTLARGLGKFLVALRSIDPVKAPVSMRGVPLADRQPETQRAIEQLGDLIAAVPIRRIWERSLGAAPWQDPPVWIHADLSPFNLVCQGPELAGIIDFGLFGLGDPAVDAIPAWNLLPASAREEFRDAADFDDATWQRGRGWALSISLIQLPYYQERNPRLAASARRTIEQILLEAR